MDAKPQAPTPNRGVRIGTLVSILVVLTVLSGLLVLWSPWAGGDNVAPSSDESTTNERSPSADGPTSPGRSDSDRATDGAEPARVPTVVGMPVLQAAVEVRRVFDDVRLVADPNGAEEICVVFDQDPYSGEYPKDTPVTLTYAGTQAECTT